MRRISRASFGKSVASGGRLPDTRRPASPDAERSASDARARPGPAGDGRGVGPKRRRRWWLVPVGLLGLLGAFVGGVYVWAALSTSDSFLARAIVWGDSDVGDINRFPKRIVRSGPPTFEFRQPAGTGTLPFATVPVTAKGGVVERRLDEFLDETGTEAFLVIQGDAVLYERYFNGNGHDSQLYTFSVAKSFVSALVGIAIDEGLIRSIDDPVTRYVPELADRDERFSRITLRHLLSMSSGLRLTERIGPWGDEAQTYYDPNLRRVALEESEVVGPPGRDFVYNDFNPLLVGLVLERATGRTPSAYLEAKLWRPLGMEAHGSWSLDSTRHGFEKMTSGINGRAIDIAKLGVLYRDGGAWQGKQIVPRAWVEASTARTTHGDPSADYQYGWWTPRPGPAGDAFMACGILGQYVYVVPSLDVVIARFGTRYGYGHDLDAREGTWPVLFGEIAARILVPRSGAEQR